MRSASARPSSLNVYDDVNGGKQVAEAARPTNSESQAFQLP